MPTRLHIATRLRNPSCVNPLNRLASSRLNRVRRAFRAWSQESGEPPENLGGAEWNTRLTRLTHLEDNNINGLRLVGFVDARRVRGSAPLLWAFSPRWTGRANLSLACIKKTIDLGRQISRLTVSQRVRPLSAKVRRQISLEAKR